ncbi:hypothetical protein BJG93_08660 [Paraburkholderia sprentiae WSM5005]|uniref:Uncharacterized protein n=1 Tax=Paraburkholderia sprentiae WSM5005 TaxID=754502 RepID=A0A1I9YGK8_9BURK|nr:hypothetical protein [Paraburkholderia sprentiae]APA85441.1 hypothetical protein BJG93_08660 [Paraburkholderia sprentiae WSM5005]
MARPTIGIFGALMALGGFLAVRYVQHKRTGPMSPARDLSRWENEGGAVAAPAALSTDLAPAGHSANGSGQVNGEHRAWPFPRG